MTRDPIAFVGLVFTMGIVLTGSGYALGWLWKARITIEYVWKCGECNLDISSNSLKMENFAIKTHLTTHDREKENQ